MLQTDFQDNLVLVQVVVDVGYLPLAESVVQGVVDIFLGDAEPCHLVTVEGEHGLPAMQFLVGVQVGNHRQFRHCLHGFGRPFTQFFKVVAHQGELELGIGGTSAHADVLDRLQEHRCAGFR